MTVLGRAWRVSLVTPDRAPSKLASPKYSLSCASEFT